MPPKQETLEGAEDVDLRDPRAMMKVELLEPYVPTGVLARLPITAPLLRDHRDKVVSGSLPKVSARWRMVTEIIERNERGIYSALGRRVCENAGWPTGHEPYGHGAPVVVSGRMGSDPPAPLGSRPQGEGAARESGPEPVERHPRAGQVSQRPNQ